jgi:hypothetical protein
MNMKHEQYFLIEATEDGISWEPYVSSLHIDREIYSTAEEALEKAAAFAEAPPPYIKEFRVLKHTVTTEVQYCGSIEI